MSHETQSINVALSKAEAAIAVAQVEIDRTADNLDKDALSALTKAEEKLQSWGADAKASIANEMKEEQERLAAVGDELLNDFETARERL